MKPRTTEGRGDSSALVGYVRVSTAEQCSSGLGLDAQRAAIRDECDRRGVRLVAVYEDAASARTLANRPGLAMALEAVESGQADGLIVSKLDRLSRSLLDFAGLMERSRRDGWTLIALDLGVDTSTPQGELMASVLATFAQFERRLIGQRTKDALAELRAQGVKLGRPRMIPDSTMERLTTLREAGMTYRQIAETLNAEGILSGAGKAWHGSTVHQALKARAADT
ncbi:recombinase family protein [Desertimonas flava]|nr:recombinase family protein [Desertimonas flava]